MSEQNKKQKQNQTKEGTLLFLGTGGSSGIPEIGNIWGNCDPHNPKNMRQRCSALIQIGKKNILIDTSPDLRQQFLQNDLSELDVVLYTHDHSDHLLGINDLRTLNMRMGKTIYFYALRRHIESIKNRFSFLVIEKEEPPSIYRPSLLAKEIKDLETFKVLETEIIPFVNDHGFGMDTTGFRIGKMAYVTDFISLEEKKRPLLKGLDVLILGIQTPEPAKNHLGIERTLKLVEEVSPKKVYLTHIGKYLDHAWLEKNTPSNISPAYDGLKVSFSL